MWIVRLALPWPYTFIVVSILILILGMLAIVRAPTDIFPNIDIPVISIIRNYNSLVPEDMSDRVDTRSRVNSSHPPALPARP
jgi:multidrug efflux pump subunit AcrB